MAKILLVTGSRTLESRSPDPALGEVIKLVDLVVAGDASGPDWWAGDFARSYRKHFDMWCVRRPYNGVTRRFAPDGSIIDRPEVPYASPLARNVRMVQWLGDRGKEGHLVAAVALLDVRSRTRGTKHTISLLEKQGIMLSVWKYNER